MSGVLPSRSGPGAGGGGAPLAGGALRRAPRPAVPPRAPPPRLPAVLLSPGYAADPPVFRLHRLMRSTDGGSSWAEIVRGDHGQGRHHRGDRSVGPPDDVLGTRDMGIFRSRDQGSSWARALHGAGRHRRVAGIAGHRRRGWPLWRVARTTDGGRVGGGGIVRCGRGAALHHGRPGGRRRRGVVLRLTTEGRPGRSRRASAAASSPRSRATARPCSSARRSEGSSDPPTEAPRSSRWVRGYRRIGSRRSQ